MNHHLLPIALVFVANNSGLFAFEPHPDAVPSSHKPGEVDIPENVKFIVADPKKLKGIVLDETDAVLKGKWQYSTHTPPYVGIGYLHDQKSDKGKKSVTWTPNFLRAGNYEVRISHCYNVRRSTKTPVTIRHAGGKTTVLINQQDVPRHGKLFRSLGVFAFNAGKSGSVTISNDGTGGKYVIADAVQFLPEAVAVDAPAPGAADVFKKLFDGKTLEGWRGDPARWSVKNGAIVGSTEPNGIKANTFLIAGGKYEDFILRVKFKHAKGSSGIQFHSVTAGKPEEFRVTGYQADIGGGDTGTFYEEKGRGTLAAADRKKIKSALKKGDWNSYEIKVARRTVELKINGQVTARYTEKEDVKVPRSGLIALQLQAGPGMEIAFKDIEIRELKP
jgi:hypothetical protein